MELRRSRSGIVTSTIFGPELLEFFDDAPDEGTDIVGDAVVEEVVALDADADALDAYVEGSEIVLDGFVDAAGVAVVVAGDGLEQAGVVFDGAGHRADVVERAGERHDAEAADAAEGGLQADDVVHAGGDADRAAGVGADGAVGGADRHRDAGAGARSRPGSR